MINRLNKKTILQQRGNTLVGLIIGLILGLSIALAVAYVIKKNSPSEKANVRPPELEALSKGNSKSLLEVPDVNQPLQSKSKSSETSQTDPVASIVKSSEDVAPAIAPPVDSAKESNKDNGKESNKTEAVYWLQLGSFGDKENAERQKATYALQGIQTKVVEGKSDGQVIWRLRIGPFKIESDLQTSRSALESIGITYSVIKANK